MRTRIEYSSLYVSFLSPPMHYALSPRYRICPRAGRSSLAHSLPPLCWITFSGGEAVLRVRVVYISRVRAFTRVSSYAFERTSLVQDLGNVTVSPRWHRSSAFYARNGKQPAWRSFWWGRVFLMYNYWPRFRFDSRSGLAQPPWRSLASYLSAFKINLFTVSARIFPWCL